MAKAMKDFLLAAGLPLATDPNLQGTPERVAEAWMTEFLDGYALTPEEAIGTTYPAPPDSAGEMVVVTDLSFHSMCPHHLLPYEGRAHVAYVPGKHVVGFGRLSTLVDCFAHRLILQEDLARYVAGALARVLGSPATACILEAKQACMRLRGEQQRDAITHVEAYEGRLRKEGALRRELWARLGARK
ncbi:GTP cyclohydrolase I [Stigmatella sp. ncwal1]|uniref:GTP cyclohydrolase I n=1 Tax=Stigmatella ashevillensis TaxID=2995309 RepID=A0ABT5D498_9BACT|nr:GTP cyclohydrolase I [Stigmatella ashevillena]MDC0708490.1 GTP cyclohydrolase I [Stigmatella ashevillena]